LEHWLCQDSSRHFVGISTPSALTIVATRHAAP
jgi:hypothetical protein